jgi:hypothetical protein
METWLVYIDDKTHAQQQITPLLIHGAPVQWVLVGCPPRLTRHAGKWLTQKAIQRWRSQWTQENLQPIQALLCQRGDKVTTRVAQGPLVEMTRQLQKEMGTLRVLDARRPRLGQDLQPATENQERTPQSPWMVPGSVAFMGTLMTLAAD